MDQPAPAGIKALPLAPSHNRHLPPAASPLTDSTAAAPVPAADEQNRITAGQTAYVRNDTVMVRKDADSDSPFINRVGKGTRVLVVEIQDDWILVKVPETGQTGLILFTSLTGDKGPGK